MSPSITIVKDRSVSRGVKGIGTYILLGVGVYGAFTACGKWADWKRYESKRENLVEHVERGEIESAQKLLEAYVAESAFGAGEQLDFNLRIQEKVAELDRAKLDRAIEAMNHAEAEIKYARLSTEGKLNEEQAKAYAGKIKAISHEGLIERIKSARGEKKISLIEGLLANYAESDETTQELKRQELAEYMAVADSCFKMDEAQEKTSAALKEFSGWLQRQDARVVIASDFTGFFRSAEEYIGRNIERANTDTRVEIGDEVIICKKLGELRGKSNECYFHMDETQSKNIPLNSRGIVVEKDEDDDPQVKVGDYPSWFVPREVRKVSSRPELKEIYESVNSIRDCVHKAGGAK